MPWPWSRRGAGPGGLRPALVNPAQPTLEGRNLLALRDLRGQRFVRDYIRTALKQGRGWVSYYWYRPGQNTPTLKRSCVRRVQWGPHTYVIGSGYYAD